MREVVDGVESGRRRLSFMRAARFGVIAAAPRLRLETVAGWWLERYDRRVANGERRERTPGSWLRLSRETSRGSGVASAGVLPIWRRPPVAKSGVDDVRVQDARTDKNKTSNDTPSRNRSRVPDGYIRIERHARRNQSHSPIARKHWRSAAPHAPSRPTDAGSHPSPTPSSSSSPRIRPPAPQPRRRRGLTPEPAIAFVGPIAVAPPRPAAV